MKKLVLTLIVALATLCGFAQEKVWENPAVEDKGFHKPSLLGDVCVVHRSICYTNASVL